METSKKSTAMIPIEGSSKYFLAEYAAGDTRVFSVKSKRFLSRHRYGLRWRTQVYLDNGKVKWVYLDHADQLGKPTPEQVLEELLREGARPIPGFPDYVILPTLEVYRVNPAKRGPSSNGVTKVIAHYRSGTPYVQLPSGFGRRSTFSVPKLWREVCLAAPQRAGTCSDDLCAGSGGCAQCCPDCDSLRSDGYDDGPCDKHQKSPTPNPEP